MANSNIQYTIGFNADTTRAKKQIMELHKELDRLTNVNSDFKGLDDKKIYKATSAVKELQVHLKKATDVNTGKLDLSQLSISLQRSGKDLAYFSNQFKNLGPDGQKAFGKITESIINAEAPLRRTNKILDKMKTSLVNTVQWQISSSAVHAFMGAVQGAYGYVQDLDKSLNNIRIVTGQSSEDMAKFAKQANKAAKELSVSTTAYTDAALIYYQQGLTDEEVRKRTETTVKMSNVTGENASDVSSYMTAIWNNFAEGSDNLEYFSDVITALGAATAASSEEIAGGLEKFASIGKTVGLSYEYATAALATIIDKTRQSEDVVGTALKTIFARIQGLQQGEEQEDGVTLNKYSQALANVGIQIMDTSGNLKDMDTILDEMGAKWKTLGEAQQVALAQTVGGTRQYAQLISLMNNWDAMQKNLNEAYGSTGTLQEQADIYAESWESAQKRVTAALQTIYDQLLNDKFFIGVTDMVGGTIEMVSKLIDTFGGLPGVLAVSGAALAALFKDSIPKVLHGAGNVARDFTGVSKGNAIGLKEQAIATNKQTMLENATEQDFTEDIVNSQYAARQSHLVEMEKSKKYSEEEIEYYKQQIDLEKQAGQEVINLAKIKDDADQAVANQSIKTKKLLKNRNKKLGKRLTEEEFKKNAEDWKNGKRDGFTDNEQAKYKAYNDSLQKEEALQKKASQAAADHDDKLNKLRQTYEENNKNMGIYNEETQKYLNAAQGVFINAGKALASFTTLMATGTSIVKTLKDDTIPLSEKIETIVPMLLVALPSFYTALTSVYNMAQLLNKGGKEGIIIKTAELLLTQEEAKEALKTKTLKALLQTKVNNREKKGIVLKTADLILTKILQKETYTLGMAIGTFVGALALAAAAIAGIIFLYNQWKNSTPEAKLKKANEELEKSQKAASEAASAYNDLKSSIDSLKSAQETLSGLTEGTREWKEAVLQVNNQVLDLIDKYPELAQYLTNDNGILGITEAGLDAALDGAIKRAEATSQQALYSQEKVAKLKQEKTDKELNNENNKLIIKKEKWSKDGEDDIITDIGEGEAQRRAGRTKTNYNEYTNLSQKRAYEIYQQAKKSNALDNEGKIKQEAKDRLKITEKEIEAINSNIETLSKFESSLKNSTAELDALSKTIGKNWIDNNRNDLSDPLKDAYAIGIGKVKQTKDVQAVGEEAIKGLKGYDLYEKYASLTNDSVDRIEEKVKEDSGFIDVMKNYIKNEAMMESASNQIDMRMDLLENRSEYQKLGNDYDAKTIVKQWVASGGSEEFIDALSSEQLNSIKPFFEALPENAYSAFGEGVTKKAKDLINNSDYEKQAEKNRQKRFNEREDKLETSYGLDDKAMDKYQLSRKTALEKAGFNTDALEDENGKLKENDELILDITEDSLEWSKKGVKVADMLEDQKDALANPKDVRTYQKALTDLSEELSNWTGLEGIDSDFAEKMYKDGTIKKMLDGDRDAIIKFYEAYHEAKVRAFEIPEEKKEELTTWTNNFFDKVRNNEIKIGEVNASEYNKSLVQMMIAAGKTRTDIENFLGDIGFEPEVVELKISDVITNGIDSHTVTLPDNTQYTVPEEKWESFQQGTYKIPFVKKLKYKGVDTAGIGNKIKPTKTSGGSKSSKKDKKKASDEIERYHKIKETLDALEKQYDSISKKKDRAFGKEKLDYIDQEIAKTKELTKAQEQYIKEIEANAKKDKTAVEKLGAKIDDNGVITNYDELMNKILNKFNNSARGEKDEEEYNKAKEIIKQWEETADLLADEKQKLLDYINQELDQKLEKIEYELEIRIQISDDSLKYLDYLLNRIEDQAFSTAEAINLLGDKIQENMTQNEANKKSLIDALGLAGIDAKTIEKILAGDQEAIKKAIESGKIDANVIESIRKYRDGLMDSNEAIRELQKTIDETLIKALEDAEEEFGKLNEVLEHNQNVLSGLQNIMDLTGESILGPMGDVKKAIQQSQLDTATTKVSASYDKAAAARKAYEDAVKQGLSQDVIDAAAEKMRQAEEELLSDTEAAIQAANEIFKSALEETIKSFSDTIAGLYGSMDELKNAFDKQKELNDIYVDDYKKIYELTKLSRDLSKSIDDTDSIKAKNALKDLQAEINELQKQGVELSEYDISYLQKKYELKLAEIALEEAQNAKSTVRMTRDSEGNWSYTYTASQEDIDKAQQNYEDKLYAIQELSDNYIEDMQSQIIDLISRYEDEMANINFSEEGWEQKAAEIEAFYKAKFNLLAQQFEGALGNQSEIYGEWEDYSALTGYGISANQDFIDSFDETTLSQLTGFQTIGEYQEAFVASTKKVMQDLTTSFATWEANVKKIYEEAGLSVDEFGNVVKKTAEQVEKDNKKISDSSEDLKEKVKNNFEEGAKTAAEVAKKWNKAISSMTEENEKLIKSINDIIKGWAKLDEEKDNKNKEDKKEEKQDDSEDGNQEKPELKIGSKVSVKKGVRWYGNSNGGGGSGTARAGTIKLIASGGTHPYNIDGNGWVRKEDIEGYDTGGYTGVWGSSGRLAFLHEKELVLNADDTTNILKSIEMIRSISQLIDLKAASSALSNLTSATALAGSQTITQEITINAEFPDATDRDEISAAFDNLFIRASQYANRK